MHSILNTTGYGNTAIGLEALYSNTTGGYNMAVGLGAGVNSSNGKTTGSSNTFIGYQSGTGTPIQLNNATAIGANALVSASNSLVLGGTGANAVKVGIGTTIPMETLDVVGNVRINDKDICLRGSTDTFYGLEW
jgi:hypothetical protein